MKNAKTAHSNHSLFSTMFHVNADRFSKVGALLRGAGDCGSYPCLWAAPSHPLPTNRTPPSSALSRVSVLTQTPPRFPFHLQVTVVDRSKLSLDLTMLRLRIKTGMQLAVEWVHWSAGVCMQASRVPRSS